MVSLENLEDLRVDLDTATSGGREEFAAHEALDGRRGAVEQDLLVLAFRAPCTDELAPGLAAESYHQTISTFFARIPFFWTLETPHTLHW